MNIKEKELAELRESEARSRIVMETLSDAIITIDESSTILFVNGAAGKIFGYETKELSGAPLTMLMPDYMRRLHEAGMSRYRETGEKHISWDGVELPGLHKSGTEIALEISFGEFALNGRRFYTGVARDITERKRGQQLLAAQHAVTRILAETISFRGAVPQILQSVCQSLGWEVGALWDVNLNEGVLRHVEGWHTPAADLSEFEAFNTRRTFARGAGLPGVVWESGEPMWVSDIATNGNFPRAAVAALSDLHGAVAFPILLRGEVLGVIEFFSREVRAPDEPLLQMMSNIGSQIGQVIERRRAEDERARLKEEMIRIQEAQLAELSTPLIPLTDQIVIMPLVGAMDAKRAERMIDTLLRGLAASRAPIAIIDITGVSEVDAHVANTLVQAAQAAALLGTRVVLTGIRAGVAQSLIGLGIELHDIVTRKTLQSGIACALELLRPRDDA